MESVSFFAINLPKQKKPTPNIYNPIRMEKYKFKATQTHRLEHSNHACIFTHKHFSIFFLRDLNKERKQTNNDCKVYAPLKLAWQLYTIFFRDMQTICHELDNNNIAHTFEVNVTFKQK